MTKHHNATTHPTTHKSGMIAFIGILAALILVFVWNFRFFVTSGPSMYPTYTEGTYLLASRLYGEPEAGDVVFLKYKNYYCMKRIAYTAGQDVAQGGYEGYWGSTVVPEGYVYVLGDNADNSNDSRNPDFGLVKISDIWGKPLDQRSKQ